MWTFFYFILPLCLSLSAQFNSRRTFRLTTTTIQNNFLVCKMSFMVTFCIQQDATLCWKYISYYLHKTWNQLCSWCVHYYFLNGQFSRLFFIIFDFSMLLMVNNVQYIFFQWLDSNRGLLYQLSQNQCTLLLLFTRWIVWHFNGDVDFNIWTKTERERKRRKERKKEREGERQTWN